MANDQLNFKLEIFDGPLDLLLTLISKQKINIYDIPIADILDQYLEYMELCQMYNAELSSEFIVMACELLYIKSKMLLPNDEEKTQEKKWSWLAFVTTHSPPPHVRHGNSFSILDFGWIVLLPRGWLCRSHFQTFGSNT